MIENLLIKVFLMCIELLVLVIFAYKCNSLYSKIHNEIDIKDKLYNDVCDENGDIKFDTIECKKDNSKWVAIDVCEHINKVVENDDNIIELQNKLINLGIVGVIIILSLSKLMEYIILNLI